MAKISWRQTFKRDGVVFKNAAISIYLAGTATAARVFDINDTLHDFAPQLYTDSAGFVKFSLDPDDFATGQLFDIVCQPNNACDTRNEIRLPSLMILNDTEGYRNFRNIFAQTSMPTEGMRENDLWFDTNDDNNPYVYDGTNWVSRRDGSIATAATTANWSGIQNDNGHMAADDADVTADQFAQSLGSIDSTTVNFNGRNDRDDSAITVPAIATDGTAIDHTINTDGSADISFEWSWAGTESDIDGFVVYVRGSTSSASYDFGTTPSEEITFYCRPDRRHFILKGVAANLYWTFGVSAYRIVDPDVNTNGFIATVVIQPSASGEDPYRPSANIAFAGNITGTVNDQSVSSVVYHDGEVIRRTDGTGVDADSLPESTARKWAGETGATVGADWGSNITNQPDDPLLLNELNGIGGYQGVPLPHENGQPVPIDCYVNNGSSDTLYFKVFEVDLTSKKYGACGWHGIFAYGACNGRLNHQMRVKLNIQTDGSANLTLITYSYAGDDLTTQLKFLYNSNVIQVWVYLPRYTACLFNGAWMACCDTGKSWIKTSQIASDGTSTAPTGTQVTPTKNYELGADVTPWRHPDDSSKFDVRYQKGQWTTITASFTAASNDQYRIDTSSGAITMTLPASPVEGDWVQWVDLVSNFGTNALTIARNGNNIMGIAENMICDRNYENGILEYSGSTYGWVLL